jgi:peptide subunit release factor 1 (eRF1)
MTIFSGCTEQQSTNRDTNNNGATGLKDTFSVNSTDGQFSLLQDAVEVNVFDGCVSELVDIVEEIVKRAKRTGAIVEFSQDERLQKIGPVVGLLRFK